jgi:parallel beta-helix repeat protein
MSNIITVSTQAELLNALSSCGGGDTILLKAGNYGDLSLIDKPKFDLNFSSTVTIAAADPNDPPTVTKLDLRGAENLAFDNILFDYTYKEGQPTWNRPFSVSGGENISFTGCTFDGDVASGLKETDNGFPTGSGLYIRSSAGVTVDDCEVVNFYRGIVVSDSDELTITNNDVHGIRMDGMTFAAVQGVLIEGNNIHDFNRSMNSTDHSDMIQFWTSGTTRPSTDIVIRDNILDIGKGEYTQSIFMRNELVDLGQAGQEMYYQNVVIEGNTIVNGHLHGIVVGETAGLTISNNSVLHSDGASTDGADSSVEIPRISVAETSTNVTITQNATSSINGYTDQADWNVSQNAFVQDQDQNAAGWYGDVFVTSTLNTSEGASAIRVIEGSLLTQMQAGAPSQLVAAKAASLDAAFHTTTETAGGNTVQFDASYSTGVQSKGTLYTWDFGDGTTGSGLKVSHTYTDGGTYQAKLTVASPDGSSDSQSTAISVVGSNLVHLSDNGTFVATSYGTETVLTTIRDHDAEGGIQLGGTGISASIARSNLTSLFGADDVTISMQMDADAAGKTGEVMRLHSSFLSLVNSKGEMNIQAWSSEGDAVSLTSTGIKVNDGASHDIDIRLEDGRLSLWIDDTMVKDAAFNGTFADVGRHDLTFGNPWNSNFFQGDITEFSIAINDGPTVIPASSSVESKSAAIAVVGNELVHLSDDGTFVATKAGTETVLTSIRDHDAEGGIQLGGTGISASIARSNLTSLFGSDDVTISMQMDADAAGKTGEVMRLHSSFHTYVNSKGEMNVQAWSSKGDAVSLTSTGIKVNDGASHDIDIRLEDGRLSLWIDAAMVKDAAFSGTFADLGRHDLTFGNPWNKGFFQGDVTEFSITIDDGPTVIDPFTAHSVDHSAPLI